jgi:hypothetical protein
VSLFLLDGARPDVFDALVERGDLPHITRHLLAGGRSVPAVTAFPSTTGVAYLPFFTGCYPGTCDVPGIRWLDPRGYRGPWWQERDHLRSYCGPQSGLLDRDVRAGIPMLFELVPDAVALASPLTRGLDASCNLVRLPRALLAPIAHYTGGAAGLDRAVARTLAAVARRQPRLVFAVFTEVDGVSHHYDPFHPRVLDAYRQCDAAVGAYAARGGFEGDHLALLVSDHGLSRVERHTDISVALERVGVRTLRYPFPWRRQAQAAVMISGNGAALVTLRPGEPRTRFLSVADVEGGRVVGIPPHVVRYLAGLPGVAFVAGTDDEGQQVTLVSRGGRATLRHQRDGAIRYEPASADVLQSGRGVYDDRAWLERTIDTPYPDGPVQLLQHFRSLRAGDLVVVAAPGADLRLDWEIPEHRSGHGSLFAEHMRCLVTSNAPIEGPVRTVDLFPLMLDHLRVPIPDAIDGVMPRVRPAGA